MGARQVCVTALHGVPAGLAAHSVLSETRDMYAKMMEEFRDWLAEALPLASLDTVIMLTMITMNLYLLPGDAVGLETQDNVTPARPLEQQYRHARVTLPSSHLAGPSKAHHVNEPCLLDSPTRFFLADLLIKLSLETRCQLGTDRLRGWTRSRTGRRVTLGLRGWRAAWIECRSRLCLLQAHLYVLQHTGASEDLLSKVQKRSR